MTGAQLHDLRIKLGIGYKEAAELMMISKSTLYRWEALPRLNRKQLLVVNSITTIGGALKQFGKN